MNVEDQERYNKAIELNNAGHVQYRNVDFDEAIATYSKALEIYPNLAVTYYNRGTVHYRVSDLNLALTDLQKAVELEPDNAEFKEGLEECKRLMEVRNSIGTEDYRQFLAPRTNLN